MLRSTRPPIVASSTPVRAARSEAIFRNLSLPLPTVRSNLRTMKIKILFPAGALFAASAALAQGGDAPNWMRVQTGNEPDFVTYIDLNSIRAGNGYRHVWVKEVPRTSHHGVSETKMLYEVDCKNPAMRILQSRAYLKGGTVEELGGDDIWASVLPEDRDGLWSLHRAVCGRKIAL